MPPQTKDVKIIAIGDPSGKTCLLRTCAENKFPKNSLTQPIFDTYQKNIIVDGEQYNMTLLDTPGYDDYYQLQTLVYKCLYGNDSKNVCCLICYSVSCNVSYKRLREKWLPELRHLCPNIPIVLVATKTDLRADSHQETITKVQGIKLMRKIKAESYVECSAKTGTNIVEVFEEAVRHSIKGKAPSDAKCIIQ